ncbi:FlgD immunoglobulin-like domain containing protein [Sulfurimonas sp. HSL-1716]|uniref:FlgD immunoglobulin-like domain containing protein n=1 Tax=Hydrocurvibacter sulfurireducens TaxID=3131937 RepID=UPI0031F81677
MTTVDTTSSTSSSLSTQSSGTNPNGILGKDDFMKLLLTEMQYQDPTAPMDTDKILQQTSQLATLESTDNTNKALEALSASLQNSQQFSTISAIGKMADLGYDTVAANGDGTSTDFEMYFPSDAQSGTITITDTDGNTVDTIDVGTNAKGVYQFTWDGRDTAGNIVDAGSYHVNATYLDNNNQTQSTRVGAYPIESVKFDGANTLLRVGSGFVSLADIKEVY